MSLKLLLKEEEDKRQLVKRGRWGDRAEVKIQKR